MNNYELMIMHSRMHSWRMRQMVDILQLLKSVEGKTLEFKRDLSSHRRVLQTITAFANTAGGTLVIGIEDKTKKIIGVNDVLKEEEKLANLVSDCVVPQILPEIEITSWRNLYLLAIQIFPSSAKPHYLKQEGIEKGTYIRVGSTNRLADEIMRTELRRIKIEDTFDKQPMPTLDIDQIDFKLVSERFSSIRKLSIADLESLDLLTTYQKKKVPTNAGVILFGKNHLKYFPDAWIQVGRFIGVTKTKIFDTQEIKLDMIAAIDESIRFVKKHAMHGVNIPGAGAGDGAGHDNLSKHGETWSLPITAIREAMINAVVHADYAQQGAPIRLSIFDDRVEIENPGLLLFGLTIEEIKLGISKLRNRAIGQVFYSIGLIERWGSGIRRIMDSCKDSGFGEPLFEEIGTHFRVTLFTRKIDSPQLSELDNAIIKILENKEGVSTKEIVEKIGKSSRLIRNRLNQLLEKKCIVVVGRSATDPKRKYFKMINRLVS